MTPIQYADLIDRIAQSDLQLSQADQAFVASMVELVKTSRSVGLYIYLDDQQKRTLERLGERLDPAPE